MAVLFIISLAILQPVIANSPVMKYFLLFYCATCIIACSAPRLRVRLPANPLPYSALTGSAFYDKVATWKWEARDSLAVVLLQGGAIPSFLRRFVPVSTTLRDRIGILHRAVFYVSPDYLSVGTDDDWARIPLTPMAAQQIAAHYHCFLPTRKMVNLVYQQARVQLAPVPMFAFRDSSITMWQHHLIIEGQRKGRKGLVAGIKKDIVISAKINSSAKADRVAIYGWHRLDGQPIQPLYTGHVNWYVDYSHGARLVYRTLLINGRKMDYTDVLRHPVYHQLICDEDRCDFFKYPY